MRSLDIFDGKLRRDRSPISFFGRNSDGQAKPPNMTIWLGQSSSPCFLHVQPITNFSGRLTRTAPIRSSGGQYLDRRPGGPRPSLAGLVEAG